MKKLTDRLTKGVKKAAFLGATLGALALAPNKIEAQSQTKIFSPRHVTAENPQGIVTGSYNSSINTANYEDEMPRLKSTTGSWYGDQVVNPFIRPGYRDKDMGEREYYGSKDVNGNHVINEFADVQAIQNGNTSYRGDVNGDGITNSTDASIIQSVMNGTTLYAPSDWNYLTKQEKIDYFEKLVKLDDTNTSYREGWDCSEYSTRFWLKFAGLEKAKDIKNGIYSYEYLSGLINMSNENGLFNLPVYQVETTSTPGVGHAMNGILVGEDPTNFDDWYFIEPQTDKRVFPGDVSMRNNEGDIVKIERLNYYQSPVNEAWIYGEFPVIKFIMHNNTPPTLNFKNPYLITSRPGNPVSGTEDIVNPLEKKLNIFPNPVTAGYDLNVVINSGQFGEDGILNVYDLSGRLVHEQKIELNREGKIIIPSDKINSFARGVYVINYISPKEKSTAKFEKQLPD